MTAPPDWLTGLLPDHDFTRLGHGARGQTWLALSPAGRKLTVKHLRGALSGDAYWTRAREKLAESLGTVGHIAAEGLQVPVGLTARDRKGRFALLSEHVEGRSLGEVMAAVDISVPGRLEALLNVYEQACQVLGVLHNRGFVHGDIVEGNLILGEGDARGRIHLMDLAWARAGLGHREGPSRPPETERGEASRPASDQWQLARMLEAQLAPLLPDGVPSELQRALSRATRRNVAERFPRIDQLEAAITSALQVLAPPVSGEIGTITTDQTRAGGHTPSMELLDAASLAPTMETDQVRRAEPRAPPSDATPALRPEDATRQLARKKASPRWGPRLLAVVGCGAALLAGAWFYRAPSVLDDLPAESPSRRAELSPPPARASTVAQVPAKAIPLAPAPLTAVPDAAARRVRRSSSRPPACSVRSPRGCRAAADRALRGRRHALARRLLERGCDGRDRLACAQLAEWWRDGVAGPKRARTATAFARRACVLGHTPSCGGGRTELDGLETKK